MLNKKEYGDFQTPIELATEVCSFLREEKGAKPAIVIEPTCGIGNFLSGSLVLGAEKYVGIEINEKYCEECRARMGKYGVQVVQGDVFDYSYPVSPRKSVLVLGNPPWVTNSALGRMKSTNLPKKSNVTGLRGMDAMTGKSNFDVAEAIIMRLLECYAENPMILAMLCKMSVARRVYERMRMQNMKCGEFEVYEINATAHFGVHVTACLLYINTAATGFCVESCPVFSFTNRNSPKSSFGSARGYLLPESSENFIDGESCFQWRQGVKHDCSKIMELVHTEDGYRNGYREVFDLEEHVVFPLIKSSDFKAPVISHFKKYVLVTQKKIGEPTDHLRRDAPHAWNYLLNHEAFFSQRKSSVYSGAPPFAMFGVGSYAFQRYKVGISGFYKIPLFSLLYSEDGKPVMPDDTGYFLGFDDYDIAYLTMLYLNSSTAQKFLKSIAFADAKRPYTKKLLSRVDFSKLTSCVPLAQLRETEVNLKLPPYCSEVHVEKFKKNMNRCTPLSPKFLKTPQR